MKLKGGADQAPGMLALCLLSDVHVPQPHFTSSPILHFAGSVDVACRFVVFSLFRHCLVLGGHRLSPHWTRHACLLVRFDSASCPPVGLV